MRTLLVGATLAVAMASSSHAADMMMKAPPPSVAAPAPSWTGFYVGLQFGGVFGQSQHCDNAIGGAVLADCTARFNVNGIEGGGTAGYNWQVNNWVFGLETDISGSGAGGTTLSVPGVFGCGTGAGCFTNLNWFGTLRGRVGPSFGNWFPYVTGGLAYGEINAGLTGPPVDSATRTKTGWALGGGLEYALAPHWSAKLEYLYFTLGNDFYDVLHICGGLNCTAVHNDFNLVRLGLNYRFN